MATELSPEGVPIGTEIWSEDVPHPDTYKTTITPGNREPMTPESDAWIDKWMPRRVEAGRRWRARQFAAERSIAKQSQSNQFQQTDEEAEAIRRDWRMAKVIAERYTSLAQPKQ
jgi:hypothetical protein